MWWIESCRAGLRNITLSRCCLSPRTPPYLHREWHNNIKNASSQSMSWPRHPGYRAEQTADRGPAGAGGREGGVVRRDLPSADAPTAVRLPLPASRHLTWRRTGETRWVEREKRTRRLERETRAEVRKRWEDIRRKGNRREQEWNPEWYKSRAINYAVVILFGRGFWRCCLIAWPVRWSIKQLISAWMQRRGSDLRGATAWSRALCGPATELHHGERWRGGGKKLFPGSNWVWRLCESRTWHWQLFSPGNWQDS